MPTLVFGDNTGDDYSGTDDTRVSGGAPTTNYGTASSIQIAKYNPSPSHAHAFIRYTGMSNLPASISCSSCIESLYLFTHTSGSAQQANLRALLQSWVETETTWNIYSTGNNWATAGALGGTDRDNTAILDTLDFGTTVNQYYDSNDAANFHTWAEDIASSAIANEGMHHERNDGDGDATYSEFRSSEGSDGQRPYLTVVYTETAAGRIMGKLAGPGGLAGLGGLAGRSGGLAA